MWTWRADKWSIVIPRVAEYKSAPFAHRWLCEISRIITKYGKWYQPLWDVEWIWRIAPDYGSGLLKEHSQHVLLEMFEEASCSGEEEASFRLGKALNPSELGWIFAETAER